MEFPQRKNRTSGPKGRWLLSIGVRAEARTYPGATGIDHASSFREEFFYVRNVPG